MKYLFKFSIFLLVGLGCTACGQSTPEVTPTYIPTITPKAESGNGILKIDAPFDPPNLPADRTKLVAASGECSACHSGLDNGEGIDYSFDTNWRSSMMAHSGKDPYWLATMSSEIQKYPQQQALIEGVCVKCHMPLAYFDSLVNQYPIGILGEGFRDSEHPLHDLAADGVSCTLCHQIRAENLGQENSFSGGYIIDDKMSTRIAYGPNEIIPEPMRIMVDGSGYEPRGSEHTRESEICAVCHTLYTPYFDENSAAAGEFPEQMTYLEWENSAYNSETTCQSCHMPKITGNIPSSSEWGPLGKYIRLHSFSGANVFMLQLLNDNAESLLLTAEDAQMQSAIERASAKLQEETASVQISEIDLTDNTLSWDVSITTKTGHKFPSGFPSRRAWLHVMVRDDAGNLVFESGGVQADGLIVGNDNDIDPAKYEPHYTQITNPEQVQIYEPIMLNSQGQVTTSVVEAASYAKDNRLLPTGFDPASASIDIAPYGVAIGDNDFLAGGDTTHYTIEPGDSPGASFTIQVELLYQSIGYRWAENLRPHDTLEGGTFLSMYDSSGNMPVIVATSEKQAQP